MNVGLSIWDKLTRVVIFLLFIAGLLMVAIWYLPLIRTNERMRQQILRLDTLIQKEEEIGKQLQTSTQALRRDPKAVERLARERFGYAKAGSGEFPQCRRGLALVVRWKSACCYVNVTALWVSMTQECKVAILLSDRASAVNTRADD